MVSGLGCGWVGAGVEAGGAGASAPDPPDPIPARAGSATLGSRLTDYNKLIAIMHPKVQLTSSQVIKQ